MSGALRSLIGFVLAGGVLVLVTNWVLSTEDQRELSVVATVTILAALAVVQILSGIARSHTKAWSPVPTLWARGDRGRGLDPDGVDAIVRWDAALVSAATGGGRARARLANQLERSLEVPVGDRLPRGDATADELYGALSSLLDDLERTDDR